jgi:hypothetical protein
MINFEGPAVTLRLHHLPGDEACARVVIHQGDAQPVRRGA